MKGEGCNLCAPGCCSESLLPRGATSMMITGSPCDPYSSQRCKRYLDGSVVGHQDFQTTFSSVVAALKKYEPVTSVFEQVMGFTHPFVAGQPDDTDTPYKRPGQCSACLHPCGGVLLGSVGGAVYFVNLLSRLLLKPLRLRL